MPKERNNFICDVCGKSFRDKYKFEMHLKTHQNFNYNFRHCQFCGLEIQQCLESHLLEYHNVQMEKEILSFSNLSEFFDWKDKIEQDTKSRFIKHRSSRKRADGHTITHYYCHRDGNYIPKGKNMRRIKRIGSNKINGVCPARMKVDESEVGVFVLFQKTHLGHDFEINRMCLTKSEKDVIAEQIAKNVPLTTILDGIRNSTAEENIHKKHFSTKKDLINIVSQYNLDKDKLKANGSDAVNTWVTYMKNVSDIVRLYKPYGIDCPDIQQLLPEDFCLILANEMQLDILKEFGSNVICLDGISGLKGFDFHLFSISVLDEGGTMFPCAFMFCNRNSSLLLEIFLKTVFSCLDIEVYPLYFISDLNEDYLKAWHAAFPTKNCHHLYFTWRVEEEWQHNILCKILRDEKKVEVYKQIKLLMCERNQGTFEERSRKVLEELYSRNVTRDFAKYFEHFISDSFKWAYCHRKQAGINNTLLEVFHRKLQNIHFCGKKAKGLIYSIHAALKCLKDFVVQRKNVEICLTEQQLNKKLQFLRSRHKCSLKLSVNSVSQVNEDEWIIFSDLKNFSVLRLKGGCECRVRCKECASCVHSYICSCRDSAILQNMCKHIHLVCYAISKVSHSSVEVTDAINNNNNNNNNNILPAYEVPIETEIILVNELSCPLSNSEFDTNVPVTDNILENNANLVEKVQTLEKLVPRFCDKTTMDTTYEDEITQEEISVCAKVCDISFDVYSMGIETQIAKINPGEEEEDLSTGKYFMIQDMFIETNIPTNDCDSPRKCENDNFVTIIERVETDWGVQKIKALKGTESFEQQFTCEKLIDTSQVTEHSYSKNILWDDLFQVSNEEEIETDSGWLLNS